MWSSPRAMLHAADSQVPWPQSEMGARPTWHLSWVHPYRFESVCMCFNTHFQLGQFTDQKNKVHIKAGSRHPSERAALALPDRAVHWPRRSVCSAVQ